MSARLALLLGVVDPSASHDLAVGEDVLRDGKVAEQVQLLEHHADAMRHRVGGVLEMHRLAVEQTSVPTVGCSTPAMIFTSVDLPAPFSPTSTLTAPLRTSKSACFTATVPE